MKNYEKPVVLVNEELAEGVYAGSGNCYTFDARITQTPQNGRDTYIIQIDGTHDAADHHHSDSRTVKISFNQNVTYVSSGAEVMTGSGTNTLYLTYVQKNGDYHNNGGPEFIGLGNLTVKAGDGLAITGICCTDCYHKCDQHKLN